MAKPRLLALPLCLAMIALLVAGAAVRPAAAARSLGVVAPPMHAARRSVLQAEGDSAAGYALDFATPAESGGRNQAASGERPEFAYGVGMNIDLATKTVHAARATAVASPHEPSSWAGRSVGGGQRRRHMMQEQQEDEAAALERQYSMGAPSELPPGADRRDAVEFVGVEAGSNHEAKAGQAHAVAEWPAGRKG